MSGAGDTFRRMDRMYRLQRFIYDPTRRFFLLGRDRAVTGMDLPPNARVLEIGCGTGRNLVQLARRHPDARLWGLDASAQMLRSAQGKLRAHGLQDRVTLALGLAEEVSAADLGVPEGFDAVLLSYCLSMVPPWPTVVARALDNLRPGGGLHVVDFWDQAGWPGWFRALLGRWLALFEVTPRHDLVPHIEALARQHDGAARVEPVMGRYAFVIRLTTPAAARAAA